MCRRPGRDFNASIGRVDTHPVFVFGLPVGPRGHLSKLAGAGRAGHGVDALHDGGWRAVGEVDDLVSLVGKSLEISQYFRYFVI